ncbi:hypothetical protein DD238_008563 [Peronospora effusa]|uniref:Uncharacterized protein n=1 Tax=Peronospora effusa TaxID=542832 RepID=A0A3M6VMC1_9STRA|nr:hypothetical protein DD238_008563 [Peronospora effusa]
MLSPLSDNVNSELQLLVSVIVASSAVSAWRSALLELKKSTLLESVMQTRKICSSSKCFQRGQIPLLHMVNR